MGGAGLRQPARTASHPPSLPPRCRGAGRRGVTRPLRPIACRGQETGRRRASELAGNAPSTVRRCPPPPETLPSGAHLPEPPPPRAISRRPHFRDPRAPPLPDVTSSRVLPGASRTAPLPRPGRPALWTSRWPRYRPSYAGGCRCHTRGRPFGPTRAGEGPTPNHAPRRTPPIASVPAQTCRPPFI